MAQAKEVEMRRSATASTWRLEPGNGIFATKVETMEKLRRALESAGAEFISENGGGPSVRTRKSKGKPK
jgi:hypothetical protein